MFPIRQMIFALFVVATLFPAPAMAGSWSWSTPWASGSGTLDSLTSFSASGALDVSSTPVDWTFALDKSTTTVSGSATVNGQEYSGSLDWSDLFSWLFF